MNKKLMPMKNHRILKGLVFLLIVSITIFSCIKTEPDTKNKYSIGHFPTSPVNLVEFNTEFDDYNSDIPFFSETFPFCFSSNRNSKGADFDIVYTLMDISFSKETGEFKVDNKMDIYADIYIDNESINKALAKINSSFDEFGPRLIPMRMTFGEAYESDESVIYTLLYSNDSNGNQDIYFTHNLENENYEDPTPVAYLNTDSDDAYPTFNKDYSKLYFTSNREGKFNIYSLNIDNTKDLVEVLSGSNSNTIEVNSILSSDFDDKCPSIMNNILVFTSNREGGFGGYDLYYSHFENGTWSEPINFGSDINTEYDEYRPFVRSNEWSFDNDMMIFSSNRPGGKGGFDLYLVGIERK